MENKKKILKVQLDLSRQLRINLENAIIEKNNRSNLNDAYESNLFILNELNIFGGTRSVKDRNIVYGAYLLSIIKACRGEVRAEIIANFVKGLVVEKVSSSQHFTVLRKLLAFKFIQKKYGDEKEHRGNLSYYLINTEGYAAQLKLSQLKK